MVTHGEPHRGNIIFTPNGAALIDWDTLLVSHPERDLWALINEDPECGEVYCRLSGRTLDREALRLHQLWWDLCEVSLFVNDFRAKHQDTADTRTAWSGLTTHLDPERWADLANYLSD